MSAKRSRKNDTTERGGVAAKNVRRVEPAKPFPKNESLRLVTSQAKALAEEVERNTRETQGTAIFGRMKEPFTGVGSGPASQTNVPATAVIPPAPSRVVRPPVSTTRNVESKLSPVLDSLELSFNRNGGVVDGFQVKVRVLVSAQDYTRLRAIRVCRSEWRRPQDVVAPSVLGVSRIFSMSGRKNAVGTSLIERVTGAKGQAGVLADISVDPIRGIRRSSDNPVRPDPGSSTMGDVQRKLAMKNSESLTGVATVADPGVADDPKTMSRLTPARARPFTQRHAVVGTTFVPTATVDRVGLGQQLSRDAELPLAQLPGMSEFREIMLLTVGEQNARKIGDSLYEFACDDTSVTRGSRYSYYVVLVDDEMKESRRSDVVQVTVDRTIPPETPEMYVVGSRSGMSLVMRTKDPLVERFEVFRRESFFFDSVDFQVTVVKSGGGVSSEGLSVVKSGWVQLDEVAVGGDGGATTIDRRIVPGRSYEYRVYAVDAFGNKCCSPAEGRQHYPAPDRNNDLRRPLITAEVDQRTRRARVNVVNDDPRVLSVFVARREVSLREKSFKAPHAPDIPIFGDVQASRTLGALTTPVMFGQDGSWTGHMFLPGTGSVGFVDQTVRPDRTYQYVCWGVDRRGEETSRDFSQVLFVSRNPLIDVPVEFSFALSSGSVELSWRPPAIPFSPDDVMGSQDARTDTAVRMMYQLQRKRISGQSWDSFPMIEGTSFSDAISNAPPPRYRPKYARLGDTYLYRVAALQSGALYSNYTEPLIVKVDPPPPAPSEISVKSSDLRVLPHYNVVSWSDEDAIVDHWEIDRAAINNYAASNIVMNEAALGRMSFEHVAVVTLEASRANARTADQDRERDPELFPHDRFFIDGDVHNGNTYIYRVTAVSPFGAKSAPVYRGVNLSTRPFGLRAAAILTRPEIERLSSDGSEMVLASSVRR